jgi:hypothetical protein
MRLLNELARENPEGICVIIDSGERSAAPHVLTRCHPQRWDPAKIENVPHEVDQIY